jgi:hypothetical protein
MSNLNRNPPPPATRNQPSRSRARAVFMQLELNAKPQSRRAAEIRMLSWGTGANLPLMRAANPHPDQLIPCAFASLRLCVKKLAELLRLSHSDPHASARSVYGVHALACPAAACTMDGGRQTPRPAKTRIASPGGPLPVSASSHNAEAKSSRFARIPGVSSLFKARKKIHPANAKTQANQPSFSSNIPSPICHLLFSPLRLIALNRGQSCLIALKKDEPLRTPFPLSAFHFPLFPAEPNRTDSRSVEPNRT